MSVRARVMTELLEAARRLGAVAARDAALLEQLRVGMALAAGNVTMRVDSHSAHSFEVAMELMRATLVVLCRGFNEAQVDGGAPAA
jgi:hypothetical protein